MDEAVSKSDFARLYGCHPAYVTRLLQRGRLVTTADGRRILVEPSLRLIEATRDQAKEGVRERWAAYRRAVSASAAGQTDAGGAVVGAQADGNSASALGAVGGAPAGGNAASATGTSEAQPGAAQIEVPPLRRPSPYQAAQTELARAQAALKQLELRERSGELAEVEPMRKAVIDIVTSARAAITALPDRVASQVAAESDPVKVHAMLSAECDLVCAAAQRAIEQLLRELARAAAQ